MTDRSEGTFAAWLAPRKRTIGWIGAGITTFVVAFGAAFALWPRTTTIDAPLDRLLFALQLAGLPSLLLLAMLQTLWRVVDNAGAEDPFAGRESRRFQVNQRVFSNTLEQMAIFVPLLLVLALRTDAEHTFLLPLLMTFWCAGRVLFWVGYHVGIEQRAIGMDWTTGTVLVTVAALATTFV